MKDNTKQQPSTDSQYDALIMQAQGLIFQRVNELVKSNEDGTELSTSGNNEDFAGLKELSTFLGQLQAAQASHAQITNPVPPQIKLEQPPRRR